MSSKPAAHSERSRKMPSAANQRSKFLLQLFVYLPAFFCVSCPFLLRHLTVINWVLFSDKDYNIWWLVLIMFLKCVWQLGRGKESIIVCERLCCLIFPREHILHNETFPSYRSGTLLPHFNARELSSAKIMIKMIVTDRDPDSAFISIPANPTEWLLMSTQSSVLYFHYHLKIALLSIKSLYVEKQVWFSTPWITPLYRWEIQQVKTFINIPLLEQISLGLKVSESGDIICNSNLVQYSLWSLTHISWATFHYIH